LIRDEFNPQNNFCKQEIGSLLGMNETRILTYPTQSTPLSKLPFEERTGVGIGAMRERFTSMGFERSHQPSQSVCEDKMIVFAERVGSDFCSGLILTVLGFWSEVKRTGYEDGFALWQDHAGIFTMADRTL
jgi:hypothetical protein